MKATVAALYVFSAFISTASCLKCRMCTWIAQRATDEQYPTDTQAKRSEGTYLNGQPFCLGRSRACVSPGNVCASIYVKMTKYDQSQEIFIKRGCFPPKVCNLSESFTTPLLKTSYATACCDKDDCMPEPLILPTENNTKNGVSCPSCLAFTEEKCVAKSSMDCTGEEKYCITYERTLPFDKDNSIIYTKGCASKNVCKGNGDLGILVKPGSVEEVMCTNSSKDAQLKPGHFIWCIYCQDYNVNNCSDKPFLCMPDEDVCLFEAARSIYGNRDETEISKRCGKSIECDRVGSLRSSTKTVFINTTCCDSNVCQAPSPTVPLANNDENGLACPTCFVPNSDRCLGRSPLKCTGTEQHCVHYMKTEVQDISTVTESLYGCTTSEICKAGAAEFKAHGIYTKNIKTHLICSRAVGWRAPLCSILRFMTFTFIVLTFVISS